MSGGVGGFARDFVRDHGLGAVFVLMAVESCGIPFPSEVIMPVAGAVAAGAIVGAHLGLVPAIVAGAAGNLVGSLAAWVIAARLGEPILLGPGRYIGIRRSHIELADRFFQRRGLLAVFVGRVLPVIRTYISFPAGLSAIRLPVFVAATLAGAIPWNFALAYAGLKLGQHYSDIGRILGPVTIPLAILLLILVGIAYWFGRRIGEDDGQLDAAPLAKHPS